VKQIQLCSGSCKVSEIQSDSADNLFALQLVEFSRKASGSLSFLTALSCNTSVSELIINTKSVGCASVAFQELLTRTHNLRILSVINYGHEEFDEMEIAAITLGFANNTTLRDLKIQGWRAASLAQVLTAALRKIHLTAASSDYLLCLSGLEVLLRSQDSKVKELILEKVDTNTVGLHAAIWELGAIAQ
jgi:hypothetical protein